MSRSYCPSMIPQVLLPRPPQSSFAGYKRKGTVRRGSVSKPLLLPKVRTAHHNSQWRFSDVKVVLPFNDSASALAPASPIILSGYKRKGTVRCGSVGKQLLLPKSAPTHNLLSRFSNVNVVLLWIALQNQLPRSFVRPPRPSLCKAPSLS